MFKQAVQRGRSKRRGEAYSLPYVEPLSDATTTLADFFNILLGHRAVLEKYTESIGMEENSHAEVLSRARIFEGLREDDIQQFVHAAQLVSCMAGDTLIHERKEDPALYIILKGTFHVLLPARTEGTEGDRAFSIHLNTLKEGECFGEHSLIDRGPASASVAATKRGECLKISEAAFHEVTRANDRIAKTVYYNMLQLLIGRVRKREKEKGMVVTW